ncbi:flagellum transition zone component, partial [Trypanosoma theileri]
MDAEVLTLSEKERKGTGINVDISTKIDEPRTVQIPVVNSLGEGEVIHASARAPPVAAPVILTGGMISPTTTQRCTNKAIDKSQSCKVPLNCYLNSSESLHHHVRLTKQNGEPKQRRVRSVSSSKMGRIVGAPYKESRSKRLRDQVMDARDIRSSYEQVLLLTRDNNECMKKLREKEEELKRLEVMVQNYRLQMVRGTPTVNNNVVKSASSELDPQIMRLVNENVNLDKRLREANAQITELKRDARVGYLHELKTELAVYQAEVVRLSSMMRGRCDKDLRKNSLGSRLRQALDSLQEKEKLVQDLRESLVKNTSALSESLEDAMRAKSTVLQLQEENEALLKELHMLRKTTLMLTQSQSELECTRNALREANGRLREFEQLLGVVDSPADLLAIIRERDALLSLLKEQQERYEREQKEFSRLQGETKQRLRDSLNEALQQERALAKDKEVQLRRSCMMWKKRYEQLALDSATEQDNLREELRVLKKREEERQEELHQLLNKIQPTMSEVHHHYEPYLQKGCESPSPKAQNTEIPTLTDTTSETSFATSSSSSYTGRTVIVNSNYNSKTETKQTDQKEIVLEQESRNLGPTGEDISLKLSENQHGSTNSKSSREHTEGTLNPPACDINAEADKEEKNISSRETRGNLSNSISDIAHKKSDVTQGTGKEEPLALSSSTELIMGLLGTDPKKNGKLISPADSNSALTTSAVETSMNSGAEKSEVFPGRPQ